MPFPIPTQEIKTANILQKYGNSAQVCIKVTLRYKATNWLKIILGDPTNYKDKCFTQIIKHF